MVKQAVRKTTNTSNTKISEVLCKAAQIVLCLFLLSKLVLIIYQIFAYCSKGGVNISIKVIDDLANGSNPYGTDWLFDENALPVPYYESGFFHVLPAVLFVNLFDISAALASGITQLIYVGLALWVMYLCIKTYTGDSLSALLGAAVFHSCIRAHLVDCFRPDTLCALLIITVFYIVIRQERKAEAVSVDINKTEACNAAGKKNQKRKNDSEDEKKRKELWLPADRSTNINEWLTALCGVLLIFLKVHYASILVALFIYYCKKKRWLPWGLKFAGCGILVTMVTQLCFPTFFSTFVVRVLEMMKDNNADSDIRYMLGQWVSLGRKFWPFFLLILIGCIVKHKEIKNLLRDNVLFMLTINILVNIAALCYMGKWNGNYINYHYIMIMSSVILAAVFFLHSFMVKGDKLRLWIICMILGYALSITINSITSVVNAISDWPENKAAFEEEYAFLEQYKSDDMLLDPSHAYYTYANDIYQWDYMDQIYIPYDIGTSPRWNFLFPYTNLYRSRCVAYAEKMVEKIEQREYSIIIESDIHILGLKLGLEKEFHDAIRDNYVKQEWNELVYWIPKMNDN